jgi:hypothetical protein
MLPAIAEIMVVDASVAGTREHVAQPRYLLVDGLDGKQTQLWSWLDALRNTEPVRSALRALRYQDSPHA